MKSEEMMKLIKWTESKVITAKWKRSEIEKKAINGLTKIVTANRIYKKDELVLLYINKISSKNVNEFAGYITFENVRAYEHAKYLCSNNDDFNNIVILLNKENGDQIPKLCDYSIKNMKSGIGQDVDEKTIQTYINTENFDMLQKTLEYLIQKPLSAYDVSLFLVSGLPVTELLERHSKDLGQNIVSWFLQGEGKNNISEYGKFKEHIRKSNSAKKIKYR